MRLHWIVGLSALGTMVLAIFLFGWPGDLGEAGGFASFVAAILTPVSLMLLVSTLQKQEESQRQATRDGFLALQVQALIALIEDDRSMLDSMAAKYNATKVKNPAFFPVQQRYRKRVEKLNDLLKTDLHLPEVAELQMA